MRKLKEEKEKQTTVEERQRAARGKRKLKGCRPAASNSGGESTRGPTPKEVGEINPKPNRRMAATGGPSRSGGPPREAAGPELRDLGAEPRWREERWRRERGMEHRDRWERTGAAPGGPRTVGHQERNGGTGEVPHPTPGRGGGGRGGLRPNTA